MPKSQYKTPISGLFGINKPPHVLTMTMLNQLNPLLASSSLFKDQNAPKDKDKDRKRRGRGKFAKNAVKLGQGGTLDPLAQGVLVVGVNGGTKALSKLLDCPKEYKSTALVGCSTDSYDSDGKIVRYASHAHITRDMVEAVLDRFRGEIVQVPPIYSALKMDGKPLYEYARTNTPLPRPIVPRKCTVYELELLEWLDTKGSHSYTMPAEEISAETRAQLGKMEDLVKQSVASEQSQEQKQEQEPDVKVLETRPDETTFLPAFTISMKVSSGTYVRSICHDIGIALQSAAHVVRLERTRQGDFVVEPKQDSVETGLKPCVDWQVLQAAMEEKTSDGTSKDEDPDALQEWENAILQSIEIV